MLCVGQAHAGDIVDDTLQSIKLDDASGVLESLQRGLDINFVDEDGNSLLMLAARDGSAQSSAILINAGAKIYLRNAVGDDALLLAAFAGHESIVDMLLAKHASLGANPLGWTPLHYAAFAGHTQLVGKFLALGAPVNQLTAGGLSALMLASKNGHLEVVQTLLKNNADTLLRDSNNLSASDHAQAAGNTIIAALLQTAQPKKQAPLAKP